MPEKLRILFVGELISSHAQSWIRLLDGCDAFECAGADISQSDWNRTALNMPVFYRPFDHSLAWRVSRRLLPQALHAGLFPDRYLRDIQAFRPHIVHTFGIFPGGEHYLGIRALCPQAKWLARAWGGSDIGFNLHDAEALPVIRAVLQACDMFVVDNMQNYEYARQLGLAPHKVAPIGPVSGAGGIDLGVYAQCPRPSRKERLILWPKAYTSPYSDGLPVVEALRRALPAMMPCRVIATAATPDVRHWFFSLLAPYAPHIMMHERIPRAELLQLYHEARIMLAPSLVDGVPNTLYEAMASNTLPVVSPLETLTPLFADRKNVLYAPNLDPQAIADALVLGMNDDPLADAIAAENQAYVRQLADREQIREKVIAMYRELGASSAGR